MKKYIINSIAIAVLIAMNACKTTNHHEDDHGHGHEEEEHAEGQVGLSPQQMEVMNIQLGRFQQLNLTSTVKSNGFLELPPQNKASLSAVYGGRVRKVLVIEGQPIKKGEVLAYLENPEFISIQQEFLSAREELTLYEKEYERKKALIADNIASAKSYQQAETNYRRAKNKLDALAAQLRLLNISSSYLDKNGVASAVPIVSPIAGFVRLVEINVGKYVEPRDEMFEIVDNEHIHIDLMVYEKDIHKVKEEQQVVFSLSSIPDQTFNARVFAVGKAFESNPRALKVHAEITDKDVGLLPGMYVDARIVTDTRNVTAVPNDAIVSESGLDYIFVQVTSETKHNDDHHDEEESHAHEQEAHDHHASPEKLIFQKIEVSTGVSDMGFTEVVPAQKIPKDATNGLNDPIIVTKGAYYLLAEMGKNERGHQH